MGRAWRAYRDWWRALETGRPWTAGMIWGAAGGVGYAVGILLSSRSFHGGASDLAVRMALGAGVWLVVGSPLAAARFRRKADAARPDEPWPRPYGARGPHAR